MSNTKTKMKTGTIAIIALSSVLVLSLVTTITLAYFTASRNVITTIQFANGVRLQMGGAYRTTAASPAAVGDEDTPPSIGPETLYWKAAYGAKTGETGSSAVPTGNNGQLDETTGTYSEISEKLFFEDLKVRVLDLDAYVAVRVAVTGEDASHNVLDMSSANVGTTLGGSYVAPSMENVWMPYSGSTTTASNSYGWFVYRGTTGSAAVKMSQAPSPVDENPAHAARTSAAGFVDIIDDWTIEADNNLAGKTLDFVITVYASNTLEGLATQIDNFNNVATTGPVATETSNNKVGYATSTYVAPSP